MKVTLSCATILLAYGSIIYFGWQIVLTGAFQ